MNSPIFSRDDFERASDAERRLVDLLPVYDKAEQCGIDCSAYREVNAALLERARNLKAHFMQEHIPSGD